MYPLYSQKNHYKDKDVRFEQLFETEYPLDSVAVYNFETEELLRVFSKEMLRNVETWEYSTHINLHDFHYWRLIFD